LEFVARHRFVVEQASNESLILRAAMLASDVDSTEPLTTRKSGIAVGSAIMVSVAAALVSAKTTPFTFAGMLSVALVTAGNRGQLRSKLPRLGPVTRNMLLFLAYALTSAAWSVDPKLSVQSVGIAALVALGVTVLVQCFNQESQANLQQMGEGLWVGFIVGLIYLLFELLSDQSLKLWLYNAIGLRRADLNPSGYFTWSHDRLTFISPDDLKHSIAPIPLFLWPTVLALMGTINRRWRRYAAALVVVMAVGVVLLSTHGTSKVALIAGTLTAGCGLVAPKLTGRLVAIGWVTLCLAILPAALVAHRIGLHNNQWLAPSARHRVIIWNFTAEQVLKSPLLGVGANATYVLGPQLEATIVNAPDEVFGRTLSRHSHDIYLQTWFELGLVGATLLSLVGLSMLSLVTALEEHMQPFGYATFVSAAVMAAASYGMWQFWFLGMFGFCAALFSLGRSLYRQVAV
jgi:hypothetical protein